ncbi:TSN18 protein, partial [Polypterus senegalus]
VGGLSLLGVGIWVVTSLKGLHHIMIANTLVYSGIFVILFGGVILFLLGFLGCYGAIRENRVLLMVVGCCGVQGPEDFGNTSLFNKLYPDTKVPEACCKRAKRITSGEVLNRDRCQEGDESFMYIKGGVVDLKLSIFTGTRKVAGYCEKGSYSVWPLP